MRVLVTGAGGLVGRAVSEYCRASGDVVFSYDHRSLDITDLDRVRSRLQLDQADIVINCAAWTDVDGCELNKERAFDVNASGPENLATASREMRAGLITISTDYVFDGTKKGFYTQRDQPCPQSIYGLAKLEGERRAQLAYARTIVVRTGFVFGPGGTNFLSTIIRRSRHGDKLKVISDSYGTPTYAADLARRLRELAERDLPATFHVVNQGEGVSYEEFARAAMELSGSRSTDLESVETHSLNRPAPRPRNSRLKCLFSDAIGLTPLPFWKDSLATFAALPTQTEADPKG